MLITEECAFVLRVLRKLPITDTADWDKLYRFLIPNSLSFSTEQKCLQSAPLRYQYHLRIIQAKQKKRIHAAIKAVTEITQAATSRNLHFVIIKGFAFSALLYNSLYERSLSDIDTLVKDSDMPQMDAMLRSLGFRQYATLDDSTRVELPFPILKAAGHHEYFEYFKTIADTEITVEVCRWFHVNIQDQTEAFLLRSSSKHFQGLVFPSLCDDDCVINLLENAYHNAFGVRSNLFAGIARLKDIEDVHRAIELYRTRGLDLFSLCKDRFPTFEPILQITEEIYTAPLIKENKWELLCSDDCASFLKKTLDINNASLSYRRNEYGRITADAEKANIQKRISLFEHHPLSLEIADDSSLILHGINILNEEKRLRIRILWNELSYDYLYLFCEKCKFFLSRIHGDRHFFDNYYDLSRQINLNKNEMLLNHDILRIEKEQLNPPQVFSRGLINFTIQQKVYDCIFHTVLESKDFIFGAG